jgi:MFS family permease
MRSLVLLLVCLAAIIAYVQRTALTVPTKTIEAELGIDDRHMGLVMGCWYWGYALLQIPAGWITDRIGSRRALVVFIVGWSGLTGLAALSKDLIGLLVFWSCMGLAQTGLVPGAAKAIGSWFPPAGRASASGMLGASMALGSALAPLIAAQLLNLVSWRQLLALYVLPGIAWAFAYATIVPERRAESAARDSVGETLARMSTSLPMLLLCAQQFFRASAMALFFTWFPRFLQETRGASQTESGNLAFWPGVAAMVGGILGGITSDLLLKYTGSRRLSRQGIAVVGMALCATLALAAYFVEDTYPMILLLSLAAFCGTFGGVSGYSVCIDFGGRRVGIVISVMNMCGNVGAGIFPLGIGWLVQSTGRWDLVLPIFAGIFALDGTCWALLNPSRPLFEDDDAAP